MNLADVMDGIGERLDTIEGLRVFPYFAEQIQPPAAVVGWPDPIDFDGTYARGMDSLDLPVWVMVGKVDARSSRDLLAAYLNGSGDRSIKQVLDGGAYTACDSLRVRSATVNSVSIGGVEYLAAVFTINITGSGT